MFSRLANRNQHELHTDGKTTQLQPWYYRKLDCAISSVSSVLLLTPCLNRTNVVILCVSRALCCRGGGSDHASVLPFWRHGQHCLPHGIHWAASVSHTHTHTPARFMLCCFMLFLGGSDFVFLSPRPPAYRIHVNMSTVKILHSLNEGYKIEVRGKTELKVT